MSANSPATTANTPSTMSNATSIESQAKASPMTLASTSAAALQPPSQVNTPTAAPPTSPVQQASANADGMSSDKANNDNAETKPEPPPVLSNSASLQQQIQLLSSLHSRISKLRALPAHLLQFKPHSEPLSFGDGLGLGLGEGSSGPDAGDAVTSETDAIASLLDPDAGPMGAMKMGSQARNAFRMLNEAKDEFTKEDAQAALRIARESEAKDNTEIRQHSRKERKKRRVITADSPAPFPSFQLQATSVFPPHRDEKPLTVKEIPAFIRAHNKRIRSPEIEQGGPETKLSVWMQSRPRSGERRRVSDPLTVRVAIRDVAIIFVKLAFRSNDNVRDRLVVESVVALGPREKKSPHSHSDYTVYQKLTQQIARMIEQEPRASFTQLVDLLVSYEDLFITRCSVCERVLSQEGHIPPVARVWIDGSNATESDKGRWDARHISCLQA